MSLLRNDKIRELFSELHARDPASRRLALDRDATLDPEVRSEVESLLEQHDKLSGFLEQPALGGGFAVGTPEARASATPLLPDRIGAYTIIKVLGEGGMGVVYLAEQERPKRLVALKVVRPGLSSASVLRRFEHESEILARLEHPGIARIYEAGCADAGFGPQPFFAMELVGGVPLDVHVRAHDLDARARLGLLASVCDGVHHAHQKGIVHRDLKPANILVDPSGQPKILDFGIARVVGTEERTTGGTAALVTQAGELVGTLPYMSPEQLSDDPRDVDVRSDVYALGVIGFELVSGRLPLAVRGTSLVEATRLIRDVDPPRLGALDRRFRGDVEAIVATALEKDRNARYPSASELAADIRRHLAREPIVARPAGRILRLRRWARRNPALAALFVVLAVGVCVLGVLLKITSDAVQAEARQTQIAQRRSGELRQMAETAIFQIHEAIKDVPGATKARSRLLDLSVKHLDTLSEDAADGEQARARARAWGIAGDLQGYPSQVNLGDVSAALESYEREAAILRTLSANASLRDWVAWELTSVDLRRSTVLQTSGKTAEALEAAQHVVVERERWVAAHPGDPDGPRGVTAARSVVMQLLVQTGRWAAGAELATRIVRENEAAAASGEDAARLDLVKALDALAAVALLTSADVAVGLEHLRRAQALLEALLVVRPFSVELMSSRAGVLFRVAYALDLAADFDAAAQAADQAIKEYEKLHAADPADMFHATLLAQMHLRKSSIKRRAGRPGEAEQAARAARSVLEHLGSPGLKERLTSLRAHTELELAAALVELDRAPEAVGAFGRAIAMLEEAIAKDPGDEGLRVKLANNLVQAGRLRAKTGDERTDWEPQFSRARDLLLPGSAEHGGSTEVAGQLLNCNSEWGKALATHDAPADALARFDEARVLGERLLREAPGAARLATDLAGVIYDIGRVQYRMGDVNASVRSLERATEVIGAAGRLHPRDPGVRKSLKNVLPTHAKILPDAPLESDSADIPVARLIACARAFLESPAEVGGNPATARSYALRAVAATKRADLDALTLAAEVAAACDDPEQAEALATEALALLPAAPDDAARAPFRARLDAIFDRGATGPDSRAASR